MTRTVWTNEEKTAVFASMIDVFIEQPLTTNRTAMHHAQNVLVKDRRVKITDQRVHTYKARIEEARTTAKARVKNLPKPAPKVAEPAPPPPLRNDTDIGVLFAALVDRLHCLGCLVERSCEHVSKPTTVSIPGSFPHIDERIQAIYLVLSEMPAEQTVSDGMEERFFVDGHFSPCLCCAVISI